ncbi:hypothetical protein RV14_GL001217 [Enterococcus ratti]|uniref:Uncharacterized protein n=1 Tax=Enterococcus ratti TaxID=150033 RepID=A0A1L8WAS3_9ENTE|nr:hypothetical protein RV14_GL001217 [Enterococcus ratti]
MQASSIKVCFFKWMVETNMKKILLTQHFFIQGKKGKNCKKTLNHLNS